MASPNTLRKVEIVKTQRDMDGRATHDILSNAAAIFEAREMLVTALRQLGELQHSSIPQILSFARAFEDELAKIDLSRMTKEKAVADYRVREMQEREPEGDNETYMLGPGDKLISQKKKNRSTPIKSDSQIWAEYDQLKTKAEKTELVDRLRLEAAEGNFVAEKVLHDIEKEKAKKKK